ncbi:2OG-Fe dioxygenase family protein [Parasalinivibrio latis]|uniref:2OG-Fe dioxygenase family protein n=1 Tax=Parasalinivibrio latis TaxID=2952610 RepID=UPI0030E11DEE
MISHDYLMQLNHISPEAVHQLEPSFGCLPTTPYADGEYRLRRYSVIRMDGDEIRHMPHHTFVQSEDINHHQGGVVRDFEEIEEDVLLSEGMAEMCRVFKEQNGIDDDQDIEIHQMRIITLDEVTPVSPEGIHQDGFDHIAIIAIERDNIQGGEIMVYRDKTEQPFFSMPMDKGDMALIDDHALWHNANPIRPLDPCRQGHLDVFVLTTRTR